MKQFRRFRVAFAAMILAVAAFTMIGNASATSANTDITDIWWNPLKSGMGFQLINTGTFIFATGFIYGQNNQPTWFYANLNRVNNNPLTYSGNLGVATGPFYGGAFDPANVTRRVAGTMTFVLMSLASGRVSYVIDGVPGDEPVQRQPLTLDNYGGSYHGQISFTTTQCSDPSGNGSDSGPLPIAVVQNGTSMSQVWNLGDNVCNFSGSYSQLGRMGTFNSNFTCASGDAGTATMFAMTNAPFMFMARVSATSTTSGCHIDGRIVAVEPP